MQRILSISSFKKGAAALLTAALAVAGIYVHSLMVERRNVMTDKSSFFKDRDYDVLLFGTSHVRIGLNPFQLYRNYGITSYNLATNAQKSCFSYYTLKEAVRVHKPQLAVLDVYSCRLDFPDQTDDEEKTNFHYIFDNFPVSRNKIHAEKELFGTDGRWLVLPYATYHNRWKEHLFSFRQLWNNGSFSDSGKNYANGFCPCFTVSFGIPGYETMRRIGDDECLADEDTDGIAYIKRFVAFCTENGIQPVLVYLPPPCGILQQQEANSMQRIAEALHVPYYNFLPVTDEIIDWRTDFFNGVVGDENIVHDSIVNGNIHLNLSGANKMTTRLGRILRDDFGLADHRGGRGHEAWEADYREHRSYILSEIGKLNDLDALLMSCSFEGLSVTLYTAPGTEFDDVQQRLIAQLGNRITVIRDYDGYARILVTDDESGSIVADVSF